MAKARASVLLIERERKGAPSFADVLTQKGYEVETTKDVQGAISAVDQILPDVVVLDAASMATSGARMARKLRGSLNGTPMILITPQDAHVVPNGAANVVLPHPFTARKLTNRIARLLPGDECDEIRAGPIRLNRVQHKVHCLGKESRITPQASRMLELFMQRPGRLLKREELMKRIWNTDYMGDTRTLDVHISWLRKAIEPDPRSPRLLKTIRGLGYRLDLPSGTS